VVCDCGSVLMANIEVTNRFFSNARASFESFG